MMHGECVAVGMVEELKIGVDVGVVKEVGIVGRVENVLKKFNLPTKLPDNMSIPSLIQLCVKDKKNKSSSITLTLISSPGNRHPSPTLIPPSTLLHKYSKHLQISSSHTSP